MVFVFIKSTIFSKVLYPNVKQQLSKLKLFQTQKNLLEDQEDFAVHLRGARLKFYTPRLQFL